MSHALSEQAIFAAVDAAWRRAAFQSASKVDPWAFLKIFRAELSLELNELWLVHRGYDL